MPDTPPPAVRAAELRALALAVDPDEHPLVRCSEESAAYIAASGPPTILALLAERDAIVTAYRRHLAAEAAYKVAVHERDAFDPTLIAVARESIYADRLLDNTLAALLGAEGEGGDA